MAYYTDDTGTQNDKIGDLETTDTPRSSREQTDPSERWISPFAPTEASANWPDERSKTYWIGPFNIRSNYYAKCAQETSWREDRDEDEKIGQIRRLAHSTYENRDFASSRHAWAQLTEHYIGAYRRISLWSLETEDFRARHDRRDVLNHAIHASVGGVLNAWFAEHPPRPTSGTKDHDSGKSSQYFPGDTVFRTAVASAAGCGTRPREVYLLRVMVDFAAEIVHQRDHSWLRSVLETTLNEVSQIPDLAVPDIIALRGQLALEIVETERDEFWKSMRKIPEYVNSTMSPARREAERLNSTLAWKDKVEELLSRNIADQRCLFGPTSDETVASGLDLVKHYQSVGDLDKAESACRHIYLLTREQLGEEHDTTLRCLAALSTLLVNKGSVEEAGLIAHDYFSRSTTILSARTDMLSLNLAEKFVVQRGLKEMMVLGESLQRLSAPFHFVWTDHRLFTRRIGRVNFVPSYPTDDEKQGGLWGLSREGRGSWPDNHAYSTSETGEPMNCPVVREDMGVHNITFSTSEQGHEFVDLNVPFIPYHHFMNTPAFEQNVPYLEYVKATEDQKISQTIYEEATVITPVRMEHYFQHRQRMTHNTGNQKELNSPSAPENEENALEEVSHVEVSDIELDGDLDAATMQGFFNNIPGEALVSQDLYVDLVSAQWADWQHFAVHALPRQYSQVEVAEGLHLPCRGYISGTWTDFDVRKQRKVHELFVVEARFLRTGDKEVGSHQDLMFAMRQETLESPRYHDVTREEKRAFCARLNPSLLRYRPVLLLRSMSVYVRKMKKSSAVNDKHEVELWEEMNKRERWDRDFEGRRPMNDADREELARDLRAEDERRAQWDAQHNSTEVEASSSNLSSASTVQSVDVQQQSLPSMPQVSANKNPGRGLAARLGKLRLGRRGQLEGAQTPRVASNTS